MPFLSHAIDLIDLILGTQLFPHFTQNERLAGDKNASLTIFGIIIILTNDIKLTQNSLSRRV